MTPMGVPATTSGATISNNGSGSVTLTSSYGGGNQWYVNGNPNGSFHDIAGICNERGNVVGLMPHPEHNVDSLTGPTQDGRRIFSSVSSFLATKV